MEYLELRHKFWIKEIGNAGIWDATRFLPVTLSIRKHHKTYNALFQRKWSRDKREGVMKNEDRIIIYNKVEDFDEVYLDSLLVHEMIHQYILQNNISDTSTHGKVFKDFMQRINGRFEGRLQICVKSVNPAIPRKGPGSQIHILLIVKNKLESFCCIINPSRLEYFSKLVKRYKKKGVVGDYKWLQSNDIYFSRFPRCTKVLHGLKFTHEELEAFLKDYETEAFKP